MVAQRERSGTTVTKSPTEVQPQLFIAVLPKVFQSGLTN